MRIICGSVLFQLAIRGYAKVYKKKKVIDGRNKELNIKVSIG